MGKSKKYFNDLPFTEYDFTDKNTCTWNHIRYMLDRSSRMFKWEGLPDTIPERILELYLKVNGQCFFMQHDGGLYVYTGGIGGEPDVYYRPTLYTISNPAQNFSVSAKIGEDGILIYNDTMMAGLMPLFARYANALTENELSMWISDINSRIPAWISAADDRTKASAEQFLADIQAGKLGIIADSKFLEGIKVQSATSAEGAGHLTDLIEYEQYLRSGAWNDIGISANYNMKREAINSAEAQLGNDALLPFIDDMLRCREQACEEINAMYGTNISVKLDSAWADNAEAYEKEVQEGGEDDETDINGPVPEMDE